MANKSKEPPTLPPPASPPSSSSSSSYSSFSSSSSSGEDSSPPPAISPVKKSSAGSTVAVLPKHTKPSSESVDREEEEENEVSESEEVSTDEESSEDSGAAVAKANPLAHMEEYRNSYGKQTLNRSYSSDSVSEDGEEDVKEVDSSSESEQPQPLPPPLAAGNTAGIKSATIISALSEHESQNSSGSNMTTPPRSFSRNIAGPSLKPLSSKPMDKPSQPADQNNIFGKRSATPSGQVSEKKRKTTDAVGAEGNQEKKKTSRRIWSKAEELSLLQCILYYKENHHAIPCTEVQLEYLLKALNDSLSTSKTLNQMTLKIRRLRQKYINTTKRLKDAKNPKFSNAHDAAVFDKSRKIWVPGNHDDFVFDKCKKVEVSVKDKSCFLERKIKPETMDNIKKVKGKAKHFAEEYPFLHWHVNCEHPNKTFVYEDHMPIAEAKELEGSCKKLEIVEIQLQIKKIKLLPPALKLIEDVLSKKL